MNKNRQVCAGPGHKQVKLTNAKLYLVVVQAESMSGFLTLFQLVCNKRQTVLFVITRVHCATAIDTVYGNNGLLLSHRALLPSTQAAPASRRL